MSRKSKVSDSAQTPASDNTPEVAPVVTEKLIDKIQKLLALSKSPVEAESVAAFAKAQALALQYGLDIERLRVQEDSAQPVAMTNTLQAGALTTWQKITLNAMCRANSCRLLLSGKAHWILGATEDVELILAMWTSVQAQIRRLAEVAWDSAGKDMWPADHRRQWTTSYKEGVATKVQVRLEELTKEVVSTVENGTALVLRRDTRVDDYLKETFGETRSVSVKSQGRSGDAAALGYQDGDKVRLNKEVEAKRPMLAE